MREPIPILWLGEHDTLLSAVWPHYDVLHVRTVDLLLAVAKAHPAPCAVIDVQQPGVVDYPELPDDLREIVPDICLVALVDEPDGVPPAYDAALSRALPLEEALHTLGDIYAFALSQPETFERRPASRDDLLSRRIAYLEGLVGSALNVPGTLHEANILADLRHVATVAVEADGVAVLLMNEAQDELRDVPGLNAPEPYLDLCRAHFRSLGPEERMRYLGDEVLLRNPPVNTDSPAAREAQTVHAQSYMRLPLIIDDQIVGFVGLFSSVPGRFNGTHLQLGRLFAAQVATAVRNLRLYYRLNRAEQRQQAVSEVARIIAEDVMLDRVLNRIVSEAVRLVGGDGGAIALLQPDRTLVASAVTDPCYIPLGFRFEPGQGISGMVALSGQTLVVHDYAMWEHAVPEIAHRLAPGTVVIGVPLHYRGRVLGVLQVMASQASQDYLLEARETLELLAPQAATAIGKAQLHEQAHQERQQLRAILDHTAAAVMVCDAEGRMLLVNPEARRLLNRLGLDYEMVHGRRITDLMRELLPDQDLRREDFGNMVELDLGPAGEYMVNLAEITRPNGSIDRYVAVAHDISQLRRLDRMKSDLIHILSHDLRNPLGLARGSIDLLDEPDLDAEQRQQLTGMIINSLERMEQLIQDVTDLEMAESLGQETARPYQLPALVQRIVLRNVPKAERQGLTLEYDEREVPPRALNGHAILIGQAIDNLIGNAIKYSRPGGRVDVVLSMRDDYALITVRDTGIGIPEASLPYIFDQFYRVHDERTRNIPGTGLGLSLVQTIARAHGGWVTVQSRLDEGSEFTLALPVVQRLHAPATVGGIRRLDLSGLVKQSGG